MLAAIVIAILASMGMILLRAIIGSTPFDRILAVNSLGTHVVVFIVLAGFIRDTEFLIDIAIIYALINFVTTVAFLMYFKYKPEE